MTQKFIQECFQYLCPPGNGVHTVHTASGNKAKLHQGLYATSDLDQVREKWKNSLLQMPLTDKVFMLGVCSDTGGGIQRGANWGPLFIRQKLLELGFSHHYFDVGDIRVNPHLLHDKYLNEATIKHCQEVFYPEEKQTHLPVSALSLAEKFCTDLYENVPTAKIFSLGGDHSVSYALVKPWLKKCKKQKKRGAIIHFDAHTDLLDERLGIDICFGSWAYHMLELLDSPSDLIQLGIRSSGKSKDFWESKLGVQQFWPKDFKQMGTQKIVEHILDYLTRNKIDELYMSCDIDALSDEYAGATGTPEPGGLAPHEICAIIESVGSQFPITSADLVEVAPFVKGTSEVKLNPEPDTTLQSAAIIINKTLEVM